MKRGCGLRPRRPQGTTVSALFGLLGLACIGIAVNQAGPPPIQDIRLDPPRTLGDADSTAYASNYPSQYKSWKSTELAAENTKFGGSGFRDYLAGDPQLVVLWAGYPFAAQYNQARGHSHALEDVNGTKRINDKSPGTCYSCKSPDVPRVMTRDGVAAFYGSKFSHYTPDMKGPIGCSDCHQAKTMKLQVSRPALMEAYKALGRDVTKASPTEMRSLVCAQCHVEYYFKGTEKYLKFPWNYGFTAESFERYYNETGHSDWTHAVSGAKMLKMQHPDFEVFQQGLHGKRGVACADCHMPRKVEGKKEFTDHQIRSPLYMVDRTCSNCHEWTPDEARTRVYEIQDRNRELLNRAERVLTAAHLEIGDAAQRGAGEDELDPARKMVAKAQMYWDYVAASNGMGFHAPQESARVLGKALDLGQECRLLAQAVRIRHGATGPLETPDLSTKEKAQAFIKPFVDAAAARAAKPPQ